MAKEESSVEWESVIGRSTALLCLHAEKLRDAPLVDQWSLLERLGLPRSEAATLLGTTSETLRVAASKRKSAASRPAKAAS